MVVFRESTFALVIGALAWGRSVQAQSFPDPGGCVTNLGPPEHDNGDVCRDSRG